MASLLFCAMSYVGYMGYERMTMSEAERFMQANVEALTSGESGGGHVVACYCKTRIVGPNICVVQGNGRYCGGDPCDSHDGNCR